MDRATDMEPLLGRTTVSVPTVVLSVKWRGPPPGRALAGVGGGGEQVGSSRLDFTSRKLPLPVGPRVAEEDGEEESNSWIPGLGGPGPRGTEALLLPSGTSLAD